MIAFFYDSYQLILFFLFPGILLGAVYDLFRILRLARTDPKGAIVPKLYAHFKIERKVRLQSERKKERFLYAMVFAEDVLFCLIAAVTEILLFYHLNGGVIRIYGLLLSALGFFLYRMSLGRLVIGMAKKIIRLGRQLIYIVFMVFLTPLILMTRLGKKVYICIHKKHTKRKKRKKKEKTEERECEA